MSKFCLLYFPETTKIYRLMVYFFIFKLLYIEGKSFSHVGPISFQLFKLHNFWLAKSLEVIDHLNFDNYMFHENPRKKETNTGVKVSNQVERLDMRSWWSVFFLLVCLNISIYIINRFYLNLVFIWKCSKSQQQQLFLFFGGISNSDWKGPKWAQNQAIKFLLLAKVRS